MPHRFWSRLWLISRHSSEVLVGATFAIGGALFSLVFVPQTDLSFGYDHRTTGRVIDVSPTSAVADCRRVHAVHYTYTVAGVERDGVSYATAPPLTGATVPLDVDLDDPELSRVVGMWRRPLGPYGLFAPLFALAGVLIMVWGIRRDRAEARGEPPAPPVGSTVEHPYRSSAYAAGPRRVPLLLRARMVLVSPQAVLGWLFVAIGIAMCAAVLPDLSPATSRDHLWITLFMVGFTIAGVLVLLEGVRDGRRDVELLAIGTCAEARIVSARVERDDDGTRRYVTIELRHPGGTTRSERLRRTNRTLASVTTVFYDPTHPARNAIAADLPGRPHLDRTGRLQYHWG